MKSFKVREGKVLVEGVYYSDAPSSNEIKGKLGKIHSINMRVNNSFRMVENSSMIQYLPHQIIQV